MRNSHQRLGSHLPVFMHIVHTKPLKLLPGAFCVEAALLNVHITSEPGMGDGKKTNQSFYTRLKG